MIFDVVTNKLFKDLLAGTVPAGDAKKLNGLADTEFVKQYGTPLTQGVVTTASYRDNYEGVATSDLANLIGLNGSGSCWWHIKYFKNTNTDGYGTQLAFPLFPSQADQVPKYRTSDGLTFRGWKNLNDGGNADTVDGFHSRDFLKLVASTISASDYSKTRDELTDMVPLFGELRYTVYPEMFPNFEFPDGIAKTQYYYLSINKPTGEHYYVNLILKNLITGEQWECSKSYSMSGWTPWEKVAMASKFLPLDGSVPMSGNLIINRGTASPSYQAIRTLSDGTVSKVQFWNNSEGSASIGKVTDAGAVVNSIEVTDDGIKHYSSALGIYTVLHTGNSQKVAISDTAPTDGLWVVP